MSSGDPPGGQPPPQPPPTMLISPHQFYFCHECNRTISIPPSSSSSELSCPRCNGGFLEEVDLPSPPPLPSFPPLPFLSSDFTPFDPVDFSAIFAPNAAAGVPAHVPAHGHGPEGSVFDPFAFLHNYLHTMRSGGANIQFVIENSGEGGSTGIRFPGSGNLGDYFFGPGLEQLIQQLAENDPNRYGTPPASKSAVDALPDVNLTEELIKSDSSQCAVCMDEFEVGGQAKEMPCKHVFHKDCIVPWLELHNSCPVCRYELPTDDPDYDQRARGEGGGGGDGGGDQAPESSGGGAVGDDRMVERRFRISLPYPFRALEGGSSGGGGENANFGSETRQEDLD